MKLKSGDRIMYEGEMFTVQVASPSFMKLYVLVDADGQPHPASPFTKAQLRECPVK